MERPFCRFDINMRNLPKFLVVPRIDLEHAGAAINVRKRRISRVMASEI